MKCPACREVRQQFICQSCNEQEWQPRRRRIRSTTAASSSLLSSLTHSLQSQADSHARLDALQQRRRRLADLHSLVLAERQSNASLRALNRRRREELERRQHSLAVADSLLHSTVAQHLRRMPSIIQTRRSLLHSISSSLSRLQHRRLSLLFSLYPLRRASTSTCTILGLPVPDDLESLPVSGSGDAESLPSALGYLLFLVHLSSCYLQQPLPFPMTFLASHSSLTHLEHVYFLSPLTPAMQPQPPDHYRKAITLLAHNVVALCKAEGMGDRVRLWRVAGNMMDLLQAVKIGLRRRWKEEQHRKGWKGEGRGREAEGKEGEGQGGVVGAAPLVVELQSPSSLLHTLTTGYSLPPSAIPERRPSTGFTPPTPSSTPFRPATPAAYSYSVSSLFGAAAMVSSTSASSSSASAALSAAAAASTSAKAIAVSNLEDGDWDLIEVEQRDEWDQD